MKKEIIVFMGGQGVGKGTFSTMLRACRDCEYIETGAMFRSLPPDSDIVKLISAGILVPDEKLFEMISLKIQGDKDILIDGFPRTLPQARWFVEHYAKLFDISIIYLNVPEEIMLKRIHGRLNVDKCVRADDTDQAAVRRRLDTFWKVTMPAIEWLRTAGGIRFADVDATGEVQDNFERILAALSRKSGDDKPALI
jgi:adenylate kinase